MTGAPRSATLRHRAHDGFMRQLNAGRLRPAQMVTQRELCTLLDMPMGPVHEALKRLEGEGVVTLIPQRGIRILDIDEKTINDAFSMRLMVEIEALRAFVDRGDRALAADLAEISSLTALDHAMHRLFITVLDNDFATELMDRVLSRLRLSWLVFWLRNHPDGNAIREHLEILDQVIDGEREAAAAAMEAHLRTSWRRAMGLPN